MSIMAMSAQAARTLQVNVDQVNSQTMTAATGAAPSAGSQATPAVAGQPPSPAPELPTTGASTPDPRLTGTLSKIAAYIPSEVIATYLALVGIINPTTRTSKWACFGVAVGLLVALCYLGWELQRRNATTAAAKPTARHLIAVLALALISFVTYGMAIPGSAFDTLWAQATVYGGCAALVLSALLPSIGQLVGVDPDA